MPAIVDQDTYKAALERVEHNKANCARRCKTEYLLRGMVVCKLCGRRFAGCRTESKSGMLTYYVCTRQLRSVPGDHCDSARVNGRRAEQKVWNWVIAKLSDPNFIKGILEGSDQEDRALRERDEADLKSLLRERSVLDEDANMQIDLYSKHAISFDKFMERKSARDERAQGVDARLREIEGRQAARIQAMKDVQSAMDIVEKVQRGLPKRKVLAALSFADKRAVLDALHIKVTALETGDVFVTGYISSDLLRLFGPLATEPNGESYPLNDHCNDNYGINVLQSATLREASSQ